MCFLGIARALPPWLHGQQSSATTTQSLSVLQSRLSAGARSPPPFLGSPTLHPPPPPPPPIEPPARIATTNKKRRPRRKRFTRRGDMTAQYIVPAPAVQQY